MMFNSKTKKYVFFGLIVLILGASLIGYKFWKNRQKVAGVVSGTASQNQACEAIKEETTNATNETVQESVPVSYLLHKDITSTVFWVGEKASDANNDISNSPSAWDDQWKKHFGGVDSSTKRNGFLPSKFCPSENPFYAALPYNDFGKNGEHKAEIFTLVPWANDRNIPKEYSVLKNRWIKIMHAGKTVYVQWEDVGPFGEDDAGYVFGSSAPKSKENKNSGIDVSPAARDYLGLSGIDKVDWQFVDAQDVPDGVWKKIITTSQVFWK